MMKESNKDLWRVHDSWYGETYVFAATAASAAKKVHSWNIKKMREVCKENGEAYVPVEPVDRVERIAAACDCLVED